MGFYNPPTSLPASSIIVGTTTISGGTANGILWKNAGVLAAGPALTDSTGNITPAAGAKVLGAPGSSLILQPGSGGVIQGNSNGGATAFQMNGVAWNFVGDQLTLQNNATTQGFSFSFTAADTMIVRNRANSGAGNIQAGALTLSGALQLGNAYVAGAVVATGSVTIKDSTGTTYRVPVLV